MNVVHIVGTAIPKVNEACIGENGGKVQCATCYGAYQKTTFPLSLCEKRSTGRLLLLDGIRQKS
jgi:hypothetical protein